MMMAVDPCWGDESGRRPAMTGEEVFARLGELSDSAWALAAVGVAIRSGLLEANGPLPTDDPLVDVLVELGLVVEDEAGCGRVAPGVRRLLESTGAAPQGEQMVASARQILRVLTGGGDSRGWAGEDDESLLAQGRASMGLVGPLIDFVFPDLEGLDACLSRRGARFLDVGVGVGGLAIAMCDRFPNLSVVGLDVLPRALELARAQISERGLSDRVGLRELDVAELDDVDAFDLAWLPVPFLPEPSLWAALPRLRRAMRPGGWLLTSMSRLEGSPLSVAVTVWRTTLSGGTLMPPGRLVAALFEAGFADARHLDTPASAPVLIVARAP